MADTQSSPTELLLVVDMSASSRFATTGVSRLELAAQVGVTLTAAAAFRDARVGLVLFTDRIELHLPPRRGRSQFARVARELRRFRPQGWGTDIIGALTFVHRACRRRSFIVLLSDFLPEDGEAVAVRPPVAEFELLRTKHDMVCIQIEDSIPSDAGPFDGERSQTAAAEEFPGSADPRIGDPYAQDGSIARRWADLATTLRSVGVDHVRLTVREPFAPALAHFFTNRQGSGSWRIAPS